MGGFSMPDIGGLPDTLPSPDTGTPGSAGAGGGGGGAGAGGAGGGGASAQPLYVSPRGQVVISLVVVVPASGVVNAPEYRLADDETVEIRPFSTNAGNLNVFLGQQGAQLTAAAPAYVLKPADVPQLLTLQGRGLWELWIQGTAGDKLAVTVRKG